MNKFIAAVLAIAAFFLLGSYEVRTYPELAAMVQHPYAAAIEQQQGESRSKLDESQQQLYDVIKGAIIKAEPDIAVKRLNYTDDDLHKVIWCVMQDSPDVFWVDWTQWKKAEGPDGTVLSPTYIYDSSSLAEVKAEFQKEIARIVALTNEHGNESDYDKALFVHDYLINNVLWDDNGPPTIHSAYGAIIDGVAVCDGYAHAYQLILQQLGIECLYVEGRVKGSEVGHAWNIVNIDGVYSHVDTTWDDLDITYPDDWEYEHALSHRNFLISDDEISEDRVMRNPIELPKCVDYGYFQKAGLQAGDDFSKISETVANKLYDNIKTDKFYIEFKITDSEEYEKLINAATRYEYGLKSVFDVVNAKLREDGSLYRITYNPVIPTGNCILIVVWPKTNTV